MNFKEMLWIMMVAFNLILNNVLLLNNIEKGFLISDALFILLICGITLIIGILMILILMDKNKLTETKYQK